MRCFLAIDLDERTRGDIAAIAEALQEDFPKLRWVKPDTYHITLRYLGEISEEQVSAIQDSIKIPTHTFTLHFTNTGAFPNARRPSVLWIGTDALPQLLACRETCETAARDIGLEPDTKPFHPHITLARARKNQRLGDVSSTLEQVSLDALDEFRADRVSLFKSTLTGNGPVYDIIAEFPL